MLPFAQMARSSQLTLSHFSFGEMAVITLQVAQLKSAQMKKMMGTMSQRSVSNEILWKPLRVALLRGSNALLSNRCSLLLLEFG
jgi:hypothetical protein